MAGEKLMPEKTKTYTSGSARQGWRDHRNGVMECRHSPKSPAQHDWVRGWAKRDKMTGRPYMKVCLLKDCWPEDKLPWEA
jgi:hypothetical protein